MRVFALALLATVTLAACGADGPPSPPPEPPQTGVTVSGDARIGVSVVR